MKGRMFGLLWLTVILCGASCKTSKNNNKAKADSFLFGMTKGSCFGFCPVFDIYIYADGRAELDAKRFNKLNGKFERQLTLEEFKKVKASFKKAKLFDMDDEYPTMVADLPSIELLQTKKGKTKRVRGNEKMPDAWEHSVDLMQEIVNNGEWKLLEKYPDDDPNPRTRKEDANIYEEIIIEPAAGISLPQWFRTMAPYGIRLINRISAEQNLWLITYDLDQNEPKMMLDMIKKDPAIKSAEFNKSIEPRDH